MNDNGINIRQAFDWEAPDNEEFVRSIIATSPADPRLQSFRHELAVEPDPAERYIEYIATVKGKFAARSKINFRTQATDIDAYGSAAADLQATERLGALTGDLVAPEFRGLGLQAEMIVYRTALLKRLGFTYAVCGIIVGNAVSEVNYLHHGFAPIGEKDIDWGKDAVGERIKRVVLYGRRLKDIEGPIVA